MDSNLWYRKLGFYNNPFSIKPAAFHSEIIGYDLEEVFSKMEGGKVLFIKGPMGVGKTTMLKAILSRYGGKKRVIYVSPNTSEGKISFRSLLVGSSFWNRLFSSPAKNMILLVDEAQELRKQETAEISRLVKKGHFRTVVLFGTDYPAERFSDSFNELLKGNIKPLTRLKADHALELVRKRIGDLPIMSDALIKKVYRLSAYNPRKLLENCEDIIKSAVDEGAEKVSDRHVKSVIKESPKPMVKEASEEPKILIEEVRELNVLEDKPSRKKVRYSPNLNVRTYEEEMSTIKKESDAEF
ncbi:AAA family ATPase [Candidatus Woesearchaeota archaeon]|nr:AAA family ATPase [Candidatus Woesearchaeota archaeon]